MAVNSLDSWQAAHIEQQETMRQSLHMEPCIPPRVLILVRRLISADGTQHGVHKHSPVLEASWHIAHG